MSSRDHTEQRKRNCYKLPEFQLARNDGYEMRCCEIFLTFKRVLVFHCSFCDCKYGSFDNFLEHLAIQHNEDVQEDLNEIDAEIDDYCESQDEDLNSGIDAEMVDEDYWNTSRGTRLGEELAVEQCGTDSMDDQLLSEIKEEDYTSIMEDEIYGNSTMKPEDLDELKEEVVTDSENDAEGATYGTNHLDEHENEDEDTLGALQETLFEYNDLQSIEHVAVEPKVSITKRRVSFELSLSPNKRRRSPHTEDDGEKFKASNEDNAPDLFKCDVCTKVFTEKRFLRKHYETHCTERKYKCGICGLAFKTYTNAYAHMRRHQTEKKKNRCDFCARTFFTRTEAVSHMRTHTGERPYICSFCGLGFQTSSKLTTHTRLHTEEVIKCSYCEKEFFGKKALDHHMLIHTKEKPFSCPICLAGFARRKSMVRHIKKHES